MQVTPRQREVLEFIAAFTQRNGYPPSVRDIAAGLGIESPNGVECHLAALERKGLLARKKGLARSLKVVGGTDTEKRLRLAEAKLDLVRSYCERSSNRRFVYTRNVLAIIDGKEAK